MRKPAYCICQKKGATADQRLCFGHVDSATRLLPKFEISSLYPSSVVVQPGSYQTLSGTLRQVFSRHGLYTFAIMSSISLYKAPDKFSWNCYWENIWLTIGNVSSQHCESLWKHDTWSYLLSLRPPSRGLISLQPVCGWESLVVSREAIDWNTIVRTRILNKY